MFQSRFGAWCKSAPTSLQFSCACGAQRDTCFHQNLLLLCFFCTCIVLASFSPKVIRSFKRGTHVYSDRSETLPKLSCLGGVMSDGSGAGREGLVGLVSEPRFMTAYNFLVCYLLIQVN